MSSNLMKTSFKNEERGGSINRYITICIIQAIDTTNLSKRSGMNIVIQQRFWRTQQTKTIKNSRGQQTKRNKCRVIKFYL